MPTGQGKSRITAGLTANMLMTYKTCIIKLVFTHDKLKNRDKAIYNQLWQLNHWQDRVVYTTKFEPEADKTKYGD